MGKASRRKKERADIRVDKVADDNDTAAEVLIMALLHGQEKTSEDEMEKVLNWAHETLASYSLLNMALAGDLLLEIRAGEVEFRANVDTKVKRSILLPYFTNGIIGLDELTQRSLEHPSLPQS